MLRSERTARVPYVRHFLLLSVADTDARPVMLLGRYKRNEKNRMNARDRNGNVPRWGSDNKLWNGLSNVNIMTRCKSAQNDVYVTEQLFCFHPYIVDDHNVCVYASSDFLRYVSFIRLIKSWLLLGELQSLSKCILRILTRE